MMLLLYNKKENHSMFYEKSRALFPERSLATDRLPEASVQTLPLSHPNGSSGWRASPGHARSHAAIYNSSPQEVSPGDHKLAVKKACVLINPESKAR